MAIITGGDPPNRRKKTRRGNPIRAQKAAEMEMRRATLRLNQAMKTATAAISAQIVQGANPEQIANFIERSLRQANTSFDAASERLSRVFVERLSDDNKDRIEAMLRNTLGVDIVQVLDSDKVAEKIQLAIADNTRLIKSIPEQHFTKVSQAVFDNFRGVTFAEGSLRNRLQKIGSISDRRAKFLARDQTAKFVTSLNEIRQRDAGIDKYIWRHQQDNRVVGKPGGKFPKPSAAHGDHWHREGKEFSWSKGPADGHPGQPIGCRCFAEPIINFEAIDKKSIKI